MKVAITQSLDNRTCRQLAGFRLLSLKNLSRKEVAVARKHGINRFYLPSLTDDETDKFMHEFDLFWDNITSKFPQDNIFWRNAVSSKMQPWSNSIGYLCLTLFTLNRIIGREEARLILLCSSLEMEKVCVQWAERNNWQLIRAGKSGRLSPFLQKVIDLKWFLMQILLCLYNKLLSAGSAPDVQTSNRAVLIPSLFYSNSFKGSSYKDPFFKDLHGYIKSKGFQCIFCSEPLDKFRRSLYQRASRCSDASIFTVYSLVSWWKILVSSVHLYFKKMDVPQSMFMDCDFSGFIKWHANSFRYPFSLYAELYYQSIKKLCVKYKFDRLILSFEGNVYERACVQAFRKSNSGKVIGYSHAVIYPLNLKMRLTDWESLVKPGPDHYISTGSRSRELLEGCGEGYSHSKLSDGCVLKELPASADIGYVTKNNNILVALDGVETTIVLLEWILEYAWALSDYRITLRFHPNISKTSALNQCIGTLPDNVKISDTDLKKDIDNSLCVLYRHSSVGMQAILNGVPAVYIDIDSPLSGDPLKDLNTYKWNASSLSELTTAIKKIEALSREQRDDMLNSAITILNNYYTNPTETLLNEFIN